MSRTILKGLPALSVQQPWAWLIAHGWKDIENRDWRAGLRGPFLVHASKTFDQAGWDMVALHAEALGIPTRELPAPSSFERGGIVGRVRIVDCVEDSPSPWFVGRYGFVLESAEPLPFSPCRGMPGFLRPEVAAL